MTPLIFDIYKMSAHDGPGLRTVLFFKGCPLRCRWCHNPEGLRPEPEIWLFPDKCIGCGQCIEVCPCGAIHFSDSGIRLDRGRCTGCGACSKVCPAKAVRSTGRHYSIDELFEIILREKPFMDSSGGGITLSGGEVLMFPGYAAKILRKCRKLGIHTAVDTSGAVSRRSLDLVLPFTDLFLYDLKIIDDKKHKEFTGAGNRRIIENLIYLSQQSINSESKIIIRTPLVPEAGGTKENIEAIAKVISEDLPILPAGWELCTFNPLAVEKYERLGLSWSYKSDMLTTNEEAAALKSTASSYFKDSEFVKISGITS